MTNMHPLNVERAAWAGEAVNAFCCETHGQPFFRLGAEDQADVIGDLLCNLRHYCQLNGFDFAERDKQGAEHFAHESAPDYEGD